VEKLSERLRRWEQKFGSYDELHKIENDVEFLEVENQTLRMDNFNLETRLGKAEAQLEREGVLKQRLNELALENLECKARLEKTESMAKLRGELNDVAKMRWEEAEAEVKILEEKWDADNVHLCTEINLLKIRLERVNDLPQKWQEESLKLMRSKGIVHENPVFVMGMQTQLRKDADELDEALKGESR
jgi:hypothetical protein